MHRRGFTLIEVMVTLVILSVMLGAVYSVFLGTLSSKKYCDEVKDAGHRGQALLVLLGRDLLGAVDLREGRVSLEGVDASEQGSEADRLSFVTTSDTRMGPEEHDLNEVGYFVRPAPGGAEDAAGLALWRREDAGVDDDPHAGGAEEMLEDRLRAFDVTYLSPAGEWLASWTGAGLPAAVRVRLVLRRRVREGDETTRDYTYTAFLPLAGP